MPREFALYKGDKLLSIGTIEEIARDLCVLPDTIKFMVQMLIRGSWPKEKR